MPSMTRHHDALDDAITSVLREAKVLLGGGTETPGLTLTAAVLAAADAAAVRLYPRFKEADSAGWTKATERARAANDASALELIGHAGDAATHPVSQAVLQFAGMDGKRGKALREHFAARPFGWSREAVDAALVVLVAAGALRATQNGAPLAPKQLTLAVIPNTDFRRESIAVTLPQRLAVSGVIQAITGKTGARDNDSTLATEARAALQQMRELAHAAGGAPPAPAPPDTAQLDALRERAGNDLLVAVAEAAASLRADITRWQELRAVVVARTERWRDLERLLAVAGDVPTADALRTQAQAIREQRALLAEPDPVPPLRTELTTALRTALHAAYTRYGETFAAEQAKLTASHPWRQLAAGAGDGLLAAAHLAPAPPPAVSTDAELLAALHATPLANWQDRTDALPQRFTQMATAAMRALTPTAVRVALPSRTLHTEAEVEAYLSEARAAIMAYIDKGTPVNT